MVTRSRSGFRHPEVVNSRSQHLLLHGRCIDVVDVVQATDVVVLRRSTSVLKSRWAILLRKPRVARAEKTRNINGYARRHTKAASC